MAMKRKKKSFNRLYGDDAKSVMYATANKLAQKENLKADQEKVWKFMMIAAMIEQMHG